jgi:hypothetical protein
LRPHGVARPSVIPLAIAHALMDGASVLIGVLLPLLRT